MKLIAYFDCYSGASGDMILASMLDKAIDFNWFCEELKKLNLPSDAFNIEKSYVKRNYINSCKINVTINEHHHTHRDYSSICKIIDDSGINTNAKELTTKIFYRLGMAESKIHNVPLEKIHFHEVGALDAIIDITGFSICYTKLGINKVIVSPIPVGSGNIICKHGCMPVPAPATLELLKDQKIKLIHNDYIHEECFTPTAAAILSTVASECSSFPNVDNIISIGYGAGNKIFDHHITSNLRFILGNISEDSIDNELICIEALTTKPVDSSVLDKLRSLNILKCLPSNIDNGKQNMQIFYLVCQKDNLKSLIATLKEFNQFELIKYSSCLIN